MINNRSLPVFLQKFLLRHVPWPPFALSEPINLPLSTFVNSSKSNEVFFPCVRLAFCLNSLTGENSVALLQAAAAVSPLVLVADFKMAERHLEQPAVCLSRLLLLLCNTDKDFFRNGGIEGMVYTSGLAVVHRRAFLGGAAVLLTLRSFGKKPNGTLIKG
ncbi:MAG: hypothetical protein J5861_00370 [Desulfovibrio sp.]|nr:hypothetical protein [Desulfovibrio sp.]